MVELFAQAFIPDNWTAALSGLISSGGSGMVIAWLLVKWLESELGRHQAREEALHTSLACLREAYTEDLRKLYQERLEDRQAWLEYLKEDRVRWLEINKRQDLQVELLVGAIDVLGRYDERTEPPENRPERRRTPRAL